MTTPATTLLAVRNLSLRLQGRLVLDAVNLEVGTREIVTLIGPNGSGKTTLVRAALGLRQADSGEVVLTPGGSVGYVPQRLSLETSLPMTAARFVGLGGRAPERAALEALDAAGLAHLRHTPFQQLSGGETRRVLLTTALLRRPRLLVLDEPDTGMDVSAQRELYKQLAAIRDERDCGILLVSHDLHMVMAATDRVVCLNHHVCCTGAPQTIAHHPEYLALLGEQTDALALYTHRHDHEHDLAGHVR